MGAMRVSVIGAGIVGCSIGLELRRRGCDVTVVDRNGDVGHGSTSASCGIVRRFYSQPGMVAMAHEASCIWADWDCSRLFFETLWPPRIRHLNAIYPEKYSVISRSLECVLTG